MSDRYQYSDEDLIFRFQKGDENAFQELVKRYRDRLMNFVYRYVGNVEDAEDIVQDTFVKLFTKKHYYRPKAKFSTWIYTIASNLAKTELRKKKRHKTSYLSQMGMEEKDFDLPIDDTTDEYTEGKFTEGQIQIAIQKLPLHFRTAVILRDIQELSYEEISKILEVPLGTVKSRINRARLQLQEELKNVKQKRRKAI
ncbi:MAG: sigma-70 family RNA polymerase sigma factor [Candidatus Marinimicrobia bacterium]|jgi:RNA polymerase sigma-70 factor (ECF subfamily)|nr:sigma-70 family RNA polymerase sigma factor [Candidatus Neomarinimicrobiota bacterium]MDP6593843.1 sigma-70 family RNA polymerase sigma factor [Candidatus Neomarinimicrobiota bacterium]MDP6836861.1 sigma-70 family RNA polymerase sigma factor [Candidatus Neomarinimicrobiota bacterium]MDP6967310.1 sigma-70 family RNA polymerase sigma factor [Candidatus Neomarinimicrobiota bacterium]|tara:strand:+ start:6387 stop:6977 length:591 start_codon:yes stop_codon:yes gene_type:complete